MTAVPLVTIGIPTFNRAEGMRRAAMSVLSQAWPSLELIICDNASTDATEAIARDLCRVDSRVRYVRHETNIGAEANFRSALDQATGDLFMWLADDDWLGPGLVPALARRLTECPDQALVCGRSRYVRAGQIAFVERPIDIQQSSPALRVAAFYRTVTLNGTFYGMMRRAQLIEVPPLRRSVGADWLFVAAVAYQGKISTIEDVDLNRSLGGASRDAESLRRAYGLTRRQARNWHLLVARDARREIVDGTFFGAVPPFQRRLLGWVVATLVIARFGWKVWLGYLLERIGLFDRARTVVERRRGGRETS